MMKKRFVRRTDALLAFFSLFWCPLAAFLVWQRICSLTDLGITPAFWNWLGILIHYLGWGFSFLLVSILEFQFFRFLAPRPGISISNSFRGKLQALYYQEKYFRLFQLDHLPLFSLFKHIPYFRFLFFWAYSPRVALSTQVQSCAAFLYDPDHIYVEEGTFIGSGVTISAHAVRFRPDGSKEYTLLPVKIGKQVTIGGESDIRPGTTIGDGAMILPGSTVSSLTQIPAFQVWGGNPAVYVRSIADAAAPAIAGRAANTAKTADNARIDDPILKIICRALDISPDDLPAEPSSDTVLQWDSIGKLLIATHLENAFRIPVTPEGVAGLNSPADIAGLISGQRPKSGNPAPKPALPKERTAADWLPLLPIAEATSLLMSHDVRLPEDRTPRTLWVAASFNAVPLAGPLQAWGRVAGLELSIRFADYGRLEEAMLNPDSPFSLAGEESIRLLLIRPEDLPLTNRASAVAKTTSVLQAIRTFMAVHPRTLFLAADMPPVISPFSGSPAWLDSVADAWKERLHQIPGVCCVPMAMCVATVGLSAANNPAAESSHRIPFSTPVFQHLSAAVARLLRKKWMAPIKVMVLDCDGVLWGGAVAEEGPEGIQLGSDGPGRAFVLFQQTVKRLREQGILLALNSRNVPEDVWTVFDSHPEMVLKREDIAAARVNWKPKSQNCRELADELNLGLDSLLFMDDDPLQRAEVTANVPSVRVLPTPEAAHHFADAIHSLWLFDSEVQTSEDACRSAMIQAQQLREQAMQDSGGQLESYLKSLRLEAMVRPAASEDLPRVSQLTLKTNQLNTSLKRRTPDEIKVLAARNRILTLRAADRFGEYGLIGVAILIQERETFVLDTFLMSCRALSRGLEEALLSVVWKEAEKAGANCVHIPVVKGPRNEPVFRFLERLGLQKLPESSSGSGFLMTRETVPTIPAFVRLR